MDEIFSFHFYYIYEIVFAMHNDDKKTNLKSKGILKSLILRDVI